MKDLGIEVRLERADLLLLKRTDGAFDYDMTILGWGSSSATYDPSGSKALYLSSGKYHMWYPNQKTPATEWEARIDTLIKLQRTNPGSQTTHCVYARGAGDSIGELPLLFGYSPYSYAGIKNKWRNVYVPKRGLFFGTLMKYGKEWNLAVVRPSINSITQPCGDLFSGVYLF